MLTLVEHEKGIIILTPGKNTQLQRLAKVDIFFSNLEIILSAQQSIVVLIKFADGHAILLTFC